MSERELQKKVINVATLHGWLSYHSYQSLRSEPGFPDLVLVHPERKLLVFWELKGDQSRGRIGQLREAQKQWLDALCEAKLVEARVVTPEDWLNDSILRVLSGQLETAISGD